MPHLLWLPQWLSTTDPLVMRIFQIAIICALSLEYDAVSLLIEQFWDEDGEQYGRAPADRNTYTRMGGWGSTISY